MGGSGGYFFFPFREIQKFRFPHKGARVNVHASMHTWFVARGNKDTELKKEETKNKKEIKKRSSVACTH